MNKKTAARRLLAILALYSNYQVSSRGPFGILRDVIGGLDPQLLKDIDKQGIDAVFHKRCKK